MLIHKFRGSLEGIPEHYQHIRIKMDELIDKILAMPVITLDTPELSLAIKILDVLKSNSDDPIVITPELFKTTLDAWISRNPSITFNSARLNNFLNYLTCWNEMTALLNIKMIQIKALWKNTYFKKLEGLDDLLPVIIELINRDESTLIQLQKNIAIAKKLDDIHREANQLQHLDSAIKYRLENTGPLSEKDKSEREQIRQKVEFIREQLNSPYAVEEVERQNQLYQLAVYFLKYKDDIVAAIKTKLLQENKTRFQPIFEKSSDIDKKIFDIINANYQQSMQKQKNKGVTVDQSSSKEVVLFKPASGSEITNSEILLLFDKFKAIFDLFSTCCERKYKTSEAKFEELAKKYEMYKDTLEADSETLGTKLVKSFTSLYVLEKIYTFLPQAIRQPTTEERFAQTAGILFSTQRTQSTKQGNPARLTK